MRARLHARAFVALLTRRLDDAAAEHAVRGNLVGDERAVAVLTRTGRRAFRAGAPATAARRLEAAVRLSGDDPAADLLAELGQAQLEAGRLGEAGATITRALETGQPVAARVQALTTLSTVHFSLGEFDRADAALQEAAALAEHECPDSVVLPLCHQATVVLMTAGPAAALPFAARAVEFARGGDPGLRAQARATWGLLVYWCGDPTGLDAADAEGRRMLDKSPADLADDLRAGASGVLVPFAGTAALAGRFEEAEAAFRAGIDEAERIGAVNAAAGLGIAYGQTLSRTRVGDSLLVADHLLGLADLVPLVEPFARTIRSYALLELGEEAQSIAEGEQAHAMAAPFGLWQCVLTLKHVEGLRLLRAGRFTDASRVYAELEMRERELGIAEPCNVPYARHAVVAHVRAGRIRDAERVVDQLEECAAHLPCRWPPAAAAAGRALLAVRNDRPEEADKQYRLALEILDGASLPLEQAEVMIDHGTMLRHNGRPREARESFRRGAQELTPPGAAHRPPGGQRCLGQGHRHPSRRVRPHRPDPSGAHLRQTCHPLAARAHDHRRTCTDA